VSSANYTDQALSANANWVFSGRAGLKLGAEYMLGHDDQGALPGARTHATPDKYHQTSFNLLGGYGAEGAQGRVEVEAGSISKRHDNYRFITDPAVGTVGDPDNTKRDRDDVKLGATFYWRVAPKTQLLFQAVQTKYDYKPNSFAGWTTLDSTERKYNFGVTWEATANTTGIFKVGTAKKDFKDASLRDFSGTGWDGQIKWSPLTYSNVDFTVSKSPGESTIGNASFDTRYGASWNHAWNSRFSTVASYNNTDTDYQGNAGVAQSDKIDAYGLKLNYQWMRNIKLGAGYDRTDKRSNVATSAYKRDIWSIFLNAAI
jgi:hypothetical protein